VTRLAAPRSARFPFVSKFKLIQAFILHFAFSAMLAGCLLAPSPARSQSKTDGPKADGLKAEDQARRLRRSFPITRFYDTPNPLPPGKPGDLIRSEEFDEYDLPLGVLAARILYRSRSAIGEDVAVSGVVLYPDAKAPAAGWPILAWGHALNGLARQCAPSLTRNVQHGPFLSMYVNLGYAVVATDYAGLGTSSRNAFSDMRSNANDLIYSVPAARAALKQLSSRWIAIGIGLGGLASVGVSELEHQIQDPNFLGSVAISGFGDLPDEDAVDRGDSSSAHTLPEMPLFLAYGIKTVFPDFDVGEILTDKALAVYSQVDRACGNPLTESRLASSEVLKPAWKSNRYVAEYFRRNTPGQKRLIEQMCRQGDRIQFERYPQSDAGSVFGDSVRDQIAWIQARFSRRPAASNCAAQR
jgi:hypothetical protein